MPRHIVIGAGGVGSWLVPKLVRLEKEIVIVDGDRLEEKNLDRQLFDKSQIGMNKAHALAAKYTTEGVFEYFTAGMSFTEHSMKPLGRDDLLWCCADNHACRREVLDACDLHRCRALFGANETCDAEAYYYEHRFRDTPHDPRIVYPDIMTDNSGDPLGPPGCVEAARTNPQLVIANDWASGLMLQLWYFHFRERPKLGPETEPYWPIHHKVSMWKFQTVRKCDR